MGGDCLANRQVGADVATGGNLLDVAAFVTGEGTAELEAGRNLEPAPGDLYVPDKVVPLLKGLLNATEKELKLGAGVEGAVCHFDLPLKLAGPSSVVEDGPYMWKS